MGYKTNYSYLYNVICVHVNCGSARDGTILIKNPPGRMRIHSTWRIFILKI